MIRTIVKIAALGAITGSLVAGVVACNDILKPKSCIDTLRALAPHPMHAQPFMDGGAAVIDLNSIVVIATQAVVEVALSENLEAQGLKPAGTCMFELPQTKTPQEYKVFVGPTVKED